MRKFSSICSKENFSNIVYYKVRILSLCIELPLLEYIKLLLEPIKRYDTEFYQYDENSETFYICRLWIEWTKLHRNTSMLRTFCLMSSLPRTSSKNVPLGQMLDTNFFYQ